MARPLIYGVAALTLAFAVVVSEVPFSMGHRHTSNKDKDLRALCKRTSKFKRCWEIIKSDYSRFLGDDKSVATAAVDLARAKASQINDLLNRLHSESNNDQLKAKYLSCANNYGDAVRNMDQARSNLDAGTYSDMKVQVDGAIQEVHNCRHEFRKHAFDPAHIKNRNKEFRVYAELVKAAYDRLVSTQTTYWNNDD